MGEETLGRYTADAEDADDRELSNIFATFQERYREVALQTKELLKRKTHLG